MTSPLKTLQYSNTSSLISQLFLNELKTPPKTYLYTDFMGENANLSLKNRTEMCELAYSFHQYWPMIAFNLLYVVLSILTLILLYLICNCKEMRKVFSISVLDLKVSFVIKVELKFVE